MDIFAFALLMLAAHLWPDANSHLGSGEELAGGFQRIPNRRVLPDYFEVIAEPIAFSTIRVRG